jgi:hypothetical protein
MRGCSEKRGLSAFSTYLSQNHGIFDILALKEQQARGRKKQAQEYTEPSKHQPKS